MSTNKVIPVLRIFDIVKAKEFYIDWLEFKIDWEHRFEKHFPLYLQISLDDIVLHLSEHYGDCSPGAKIFIETTNLEQRCRDLAAKNYKFYKPGIEMAPWNARTMELIDPFGNKLLFNESL